MPVTHYAPAKHPLVGASEVALQAVRLLTRLEFVGVVPRSSTAFSLDAVTLASALGVLAQHGVARDAVAIASDGSAAAWQKAVARAAEALQESPLPATTWPVMRDVLGDELLAELIAVSATSLRRYASSVRGAPDDVVLRLHALALVVADLAGAYTDVGIRQWFRRRRSQLGGASPLQVLAGGFTPDGEPAAAVARLAGRLTAPLAT